MAHQCKVSQILIVDSVVALADLVISFSEGFVRQIESLYMGLFI